jgi:hypothetical protein
MANSYGLCTAEMFRVTLYVHCLSSYLLVLLPRSHISTNFKCCVTRSCVSLLLFSVAIYAHYLRLYLSIHFPVRETSLYFLRTLLIL